MIEQKMPPEQKFWPKDLKTNLTSTQIHMHCPSQNPTTAFIAICSGTDLEVTATEELILTIKKNVC